MQKLGMNSHLPTAIRHGPQLYGGLALCDLQTEGRLEAIKFMRNAIFSDTPAGRLIVTNLQHSQREAGIPEPLLEVPDLYLSYLTPTWVTSVRQYLSRHNITITVNNDGTTPLTKGDQHIMQPLHLQRYTPIQHKDLNLVRLYLQIYSLQDMTDPTKSSRINLDYLDGRRPITMKPQTTWPTQPPPTSAQRKLWNGFIKSSYLRYAPYWLQAPPLPVVSSSLSSLENSDVAVEGISFKTLIKALPRTERRMVESINFEDKMTAILSTLSRKKTVTIASDGGLKGNQGTFGWLITQQLKVLLHGSGPVDSHPDTSTSTRSELWGYASALLSLTLLSRCGGCKPKCRLRWVVDSTAAISRVRKFLKWGHLKRGRQPPDIDVLSLISKYYKELGKRVRIRWVKAHQDSTEGTDITKLSIPAQLNIKADHLATEYRLHGRKRSSSNLDHQPGQGISFSIMG
jgi:ribonuclease HI